MNKKFPADQANCISARKSVRKFLPDLPSITDIEDAIHLAQRSPSYKNTQPWEIIAVRGQQKDLLSNMLLDLLKQNAPKTSDLPTPTEWPDEYLIRIEDMMSKRMEWIKKNTSPKSKGSGISPQEQNFRFYGAPVALFFYQHKALPLWSILDAGMFVQTVMLTLCEKGIGSVPKAFLTDYSKEVKTFLEIPNDRRLLLGMSIGYPDMEHYSLQYYTERVELKKIFAWKENS